MKKTFWLAAGLATLFVLIGFFKRSPLLPGVPANTLDDWYGGTALFCGMLGLILGLGGGYWVRRSTQYKPSARLAAVSTRAAMWGVVIVALGYAGSLAVGLLMVMQSVQFPISTGERITDIVLTSGKFHFWCGGMGALIAATSYFGMITFGRPWGGSYSLMKLSLNRGN